jgi:hypothetical protein
MPEGGQDYAAPPIRVWHAASRARLAELMHGANWYSMGAGGFDQVPAIPNLVRVKQPANPNRPAAVRITQAYTTEELPQKMTLAQKLEHRFGVI